MCGPGRHLFIRPLVLTRDPLKLASSSIAFASENWRLAKVRGISATR
jgi:hypothetical protein